MPDANAPGGKRTVELPAVAGLPVDQHLGNLEGKELRFGTSAGATFAALTVDVTDGAVNAEHDSLNPLAVLGPYVGMWINCIYGGKGVGMINMLLFLIIGVFIVGQMVGRTPEYLGKKIGAREMKLAMIALLVHPIMILWPTGSVCGNGVGHESHEQSRPARFLADPVPVLLVVGEQRLGIGWLGRGVWLQCQSQPGADGRAVGHRQRPGDRRQPLSAHHRADRHGSQPRTKEDGAIRARNFARRYRHLRRGALRRHHHHCRPAVLAGGGAGPVRRAFWADTVRWLSANAVQLNKEVLHMAIQLV